MTHRFRRRGFLRLGTGALISVAVGPGIVGRAAAAAAARPAPIPPGRPLLVMIDAGHGGRDPGAVGVEGLLEKHVTLDIARHMRQALSDVRRVRAKLTRDSDIYLPLAERVRIGREAGANLFISIHADSAPNTGARGLSAYTVSERASDEFARRLAVQENAVDPKDGFDPRNQDPDVAAILFDLRARHTREAALLAQNALVEAAGHGSLRLLDHPRRAANFAVLRAPDVPSVLIETGFLSNLQDEELLRAPGQRRHIAEVLAGELAKLLVDGHFA